MSSGRPMRRIGTVLATICLPSSEPRAKAIIFDSKGPGAMAFTFTWSRTRFLARWRVRARMPALVVL